MSIKFDQFLILFLSIICQACAIYFVPLVYECDAAVYFNYNLATTYRPPGFSFLINATGQHFLNSFYGTLFVHAFLGVLSPLLMYRILLPASRILALIFSITFLISFVPFTAAKLMLATQLFMFLTIASVYSLSLYYFDRRPVYVYLTTALGLLTMFTRWEGQFVLGFSIVLISYLEVRRAKRWRHSIICLAVISFVLAGWSYNRSVVSNDKQLFGTLQNGTGDQLFWRIYRYLPNSVTALENKVFGGGKSKSLGIKSVQTNQNSLIAKTNGPASYQLYQLLMQIAKKRPSNGLFNPQRGYFTKFGGNPQRLVDDIFANPDDTYVFSVPRELKKEIGAVKSEKLLLAVSREAISEHPVILLKFLDEASSFLGLKISSLFNSDPKWRQSVFQYWGIFHYANVPFNLGNCAKNTLSKGLLEEYERDSKRSLKLPVNEFSKIASSGRNWVRNLYGVLFVLTLCFIPFAQYRGFFSAVALIVGASMGVAGSLGGGAYSRYEYSVLPLVILSTAGGILGFKNICRLLFGKLFLKIGR